MSDIVTRLLLKTNDFDANLNSARSSVNSFQSGITNMAKSAGGSVLKFAGTLGVAVGAAEGAKKVIDSTQTTGDAYVKMMDQAKASVDSFFASIALGNLDGFAANLQNVIDKAGDLSVALDNLGTKTLFNNAEVDDLNTKYQLEINAAKARNISDEERNKHLAKAREYLIEIAGLQGSLATANTDASYTAFQAEIAKVGFNHNVSREMWDYLIKDSKRSDIEKTASAHKTKISDYDKRINLSMDYNDATGKMTDTDETKKIRAELKKYKESRFGLYGELNRAFIEAQDEEGSMIKKALDMRKAANSLKVAVSNRKLEADNVDVKINGSYNKKNGGGKNGGSGKESEEPVKDTIAWYDAEITKLNKKLINTTDTQARNAIQSSIAELEGKRMNLQVEASGNSIESINIQLSSLNKRLISETDMQARGTIQATINELEQKKINLKFVVDQEAFKIAHGSMKDGALSMPIKPTYDKVPTHGDSGSKYQLETPKYEPLFKKEDIKLNEEYAESLSVVGGMMGNLSGLFDEDTAAALQWGATLFSTIAQAVMSFTAMIGVKNADTITTQTNTGAEIGNAAAKTMSAHAGIPFAGIAIGLAGVAAIIAAMSSIPKFATGGIVPGTSFTGDKVPALLNSGEMILNGGQQSNLFKMINSGIPGLSSVNMRPTIGAGGINLSKLISPDDRTSRVEVSGDFKVRGCDLNLALKNYDRRMNKIR